MIPRRILTINSGSSSIKYSVYQMGDREECLVSGKLDNLQAEPREAAISSLLDELHARKSLDGVTAIGYRIVHGGMRHSEPERLTPELIAELKELAPLAPDHLPDQILAIESFTRHAPELAPVACFDTAFHRTMPRVAQLYGLTRELADQGIVRYGFHGLSYSYLVQELREQNALPARVIIAHLGNGASMAAIRDGVSIDTSMGLTPTGGFLMSTRSGDLDPGVVLHLIRQKKMSPDDVNELVAKKGGLKGLSGIGSDMRVLESKAASHPRAAEAIEVFCYQIRRFLGAYFAVLGGLDLLVFSGGIGENSP
ncbi:MAG: acetate kinase, partial [Bryobacterales bacterium]|nr:acetate kinase [Bryobacterales bacterium]